MEFNSIPVPANHAEFHGDQTGTLAYWIVLLTDSSTEVTLMQFIEDWNFVIRTPEGVKSSSSMTV